MLPLMGCRSSFGWFVVVPGCGGGGSGGPEEVAVDSLGLFVLRSCFRDPLDLLESLSTSILGAFGVEGGLGVGAVGGWIGFGGGGAVVHGGLVGLAGGPLGLSACRCPARERDRDVEVPGSVVGSMSVSAPLSLLVRDRVVTEGTGEVSGVSGDLWGIGRSDSDKGIKSSTSSSVSWGFGGWPGAVGVRGMLLQTCLGMS